MNYLKTSAKVYYVVSDSIGGLMEVKFGAQKQFVVADETKGFNCSLL